MCVCILGNQSHLQIKKSTIVQNKVFSTVHVTLLLAILCLLTVWNLMLVRRMEQAAHRHIL